jgi:hypothetical protein
MEYNQEENVSGNLYPTGSDILDMIEDREQEWTIDATVPTPCDLHQEVILSEIRRVMKQDAITYAGDDSTKEPLPQEELEEIKMRTGQLEALLKIKPARKTPRFFIDYFPEKVYCSPYKYDLLIRVPTSVYSTSNIVFGYLDAETGQEIKENVKGKPSVDLGKTKVTESLGVTEIQYRVCFTVCSFHHFRRPFIFTASLKPKDSNTTLVKEINFFTSKAFLTFARKNIREDEVAWMSEDEEDVLGKRGFDEEHAKRKRVKTNHGQEMIKMMQEFDQDALDELDDLAEPREM